MRDASSRVDRRDRRTACRDDGWAPMEVVVAASLVIVDDYSAAPWAHDHPRVEARRTIRQFAS